MIKQIWCTFLVLTLMVSCSSNEKEKKSDDKLDNSPVKTEAPSNIEKEFDTVVAANPVKSEAVLLKFNFQKGRVYNYAMNFDLTQTKGEKKASTSMKWNYDMEVVESKKDIRTIKTTYKRIDMTMNMGGDQNMEFSSEKEVDAMDFMQLPSKMFSIIKGKSFTMQVNEKGEIVSVTGFDKIGEAVIAEMNLPAEMKPMMRARFQKQFSDDQVKEMFSQWFSVYPNKPVKIGDTWKTKTAITGLEQTASTVYTVKNIKENKVYIGGQSKVAGDKSSETITSKLIIDANTGLMLDGVFDQKSGGTDKRIKSRIIGKEL